jgi:hypothetical protein
MNKFSEGGVNQRKQQQALLMVMSQELRRGPAVRLGDEDNVLEYVVSPSTAPSHLVLS